MKGFLRLGLAAAGLLAFACGSAAAQSYPSRALKLIVPFPAGGPADAIGRIVAERLSANIAQPVVIENRSGAGGVTGIAAVAKADPNGYTIGIASSGTLAINVALQEKMPYTPLRDLTLITQAVAAPELFVVGKSVTAKDFKELIAQAKAQPGKLNYASTGPGGMPHLASELLKLTAQIDIVHVPYKGAAPAVNDLLGGHVHMMFADVPVLLGAVQSGKLRAFAVGSKQRVPVLPDVPTTAELGMPEVEADNWYGMVAPKGMPADVTSKLHSEIVKALSAPDVKKRLETQGLRVVANPAAEFAGYVAQETDRWSQIIKKGNIKVK